MPIDIVVDGMGSDRAPEPEVRGAVLACRNLDVRVHLVGPPEILQPALDHALRAPRWPGSARPDIHIVPAAEWIAMDDKAAQAVRTKRDSSMRVGLRMVREGAAAGFFTAGNTGAAMATAKLVLGMLAGVHRPALATVIPTVTGSPSLLLDVGANVDCDPDNLVQFAVMGHMYARNILGVRQPRVGLLSIGEEDSKGNALTRDTLPFCCAPPPASTSSATSRGATSSTAASTSPSAMASSATSPSRPAKAPPNSSPPCCARPSSPPSPRRSAPSLQPPGFQRVQKAARLLRVRRRASARRARRLHRRPRIVQ